MNATATSPQQTAIDRSRQLDPDLARIAKLRPGAYQVLGEHDWYEVTVDAAGYRCTCKAGQHREACWHRASAYRMRLACRALKPTAPAPSTTVKPLTGAQARKDLWG